MDILYSRYYLPAMEIMKQLAGETIRTEREQEEVRHAMQVYEEQYLKDIAIKNGEAS